VLAPRRGVAFVVDLDHGEVGHEAVGGGAVPVVFTGLEEDPVTGPDDLDRAAAALHEADALGGVDGLAVRMGVPGGPGAGGKWTLLADRRDPPDRVATASTYTTPVNHSLGPAAVWMELLVICMSFSVVVRAGTRSARGSTAATRASRPS
jgi:hypothetical protein